MKNSRDTELVNIGRIGSSVGLRGEVRVTLYARDSENLKEGKVLLLKHSRNHMPKPRSAREGMTTHERGGESGRIGKSVESGENGEIETKILGVRLQKDRPVLRLAGVTDRTAADSLRDMEIYISEDQLDELPEGEHYVRNLIGARVHDIASNTDVGVLTDVVQNTAQSILEVETGEGKTVLIPAVDAFLRSINEEAGLIEVELIPGFI